MEYDPKQLFHHITVHVLALFRISLYVSSCPHIYTYIMHVSSQHLSEVLHKSAAKYPSSQDHGSVENGYIWKVTILLEGSIFDWTMVPEVYPTSAQTPRHVLEGVEDFWWLPHFLDGARESKVGSGISRE